MVIILCKSLGNMLHSAGLLPWALQVFTEFLIEGISYGLKIVNVILIVLPTALERHDSCKSFGNMSIF